MIFNSFGKRMNFAVIVYTQKRLKNRSSTHWSVLAKKKFPKDKALEHFDDFYKTVYGKKWPSIRLALLSPHKYCALVNNFGDTEDILKHFQNQGALNVRSLFELEDDRIKEDRRLKMRQKEMGIIHRLDQETESMLLKTVQEEANRDDSGDAVVESSPDPEPALEDIVSETSESHPLSLSAILSKAEFDVERLIDPSVGLSASTLHEFVPATKLKGLEEMIPESDHYRYYSKDADFPVKSVKEHILPFPPYLQVLAYERGNITSFPSPRRASTGVFNYYLLVGCSLLPVLALGLGPGDRVLDMCAAPGGKSLAVLQTLYPELLVCNDVQESRVKRIRSVFDQYLYDLPKWQDRLRITQEDGRCINEQDVYNKILVDVPCTTDRHVLHENDNNIFKSTRIKERLRLPEIQADLLCNALKLVCPGGTVVYSTCSLSPIQNDGVVHMALRRIWQETNIELVVSDLAPALQQTQVLFKLGNNVGLKYGHLVLPFLPANFGPMYFCKIVRVK
ncbi:5-methylcytosine rRNA methyltransferase NSUN4 [Bacillus rossius redtenbacheri]|uniref:5-methylcytosine rRNA methyltransferase NSUN4 n=1 Tax=Bacillus rossius redtenbacheri TaxID=93214 RepID=UPI002FDEE701